MEGTGLTVFSDLSLSTLYDRPNLSLSMFCNLKTKNQNLVKSKYLNKFNPTNLIPRSKKERKENLYQWQFQRSDGNNGVDGFLQVCVVSPLLGSPALTLGLCLCYSVRVFGAPPLSLSFLRVPIFLSFFLFFFKRLVSFYTERFQTVF